MGGERQSNAKTKNQERNIGRAHEDPCYEAARVIQPWLLRQQSVRARLPITLRSIDWRSQGGDDPPMADDLDPREAERTRRRDHESAAQERELLRPGMGKVFKQIQDAQLKAAREAPKRRRRKPA